MKYHFNEAKILLPKTGFEKWSVVACDQYTSEQKYWDKVKNTVADAPSALNIILPEIYLSDDNSERIDSINENMKKYVDEGVFTEYENAMIYVERESNNTKRLGIVGVIDLNDYDYNKGSNALIRATEQTVLERIPPRVAIRKDAPLEMPHVMLLIDDKDKKVIEPLQNKKAEFSTAYDFELMQGGGHIEGYFLDKDTIKAVKDALESLLSGSDNDMLFAVGDGNHSLATAKECYRQNPTELNRYALVEIVNIHDASIEFEPIYRVLFNVDANDFMTKFITSHRVADGDPTHTYECVTKDGSEKVGVKATAKLPVGTLQVFIDEYLKENPQVKIDYIHGEDVVYDLCKKENTLGFIFEGMGKDDLFPAVRADGSLPRKTFSMGHAHDKRYYIEARKIK
ncbi:MAG: DUF1015 domain-containing protein [Ruminococcaceae bacterium]|nr:DUF1015 domain-containing protein [Oscillospiraceae bacterium]